ncbi:MAG TPA: GGDEF domain-containing protein, partial [Thermoanaerobaculia bacterium]
TLANLAHVLTVYYPAALALLAVGYASTLFFAWWARRRWRRGLPADLVSWWILFDVALITAAIPFTGGFESPWWIWYLACAGTAALHRGKRFAVAGALATAVLYVGVLEALGAIHGADHGFFLALSRLTFMGGASFALLRNTRRLRESRSTIQILNAELGVRAQDLERVNRELQDMADLLRDVTLRDPLTHLRNRRYLEQTISDEVLAHRSHPALDRRSRPPGLGSGVLMLDLDDFKSINDQWGHPTGDLALKHLASVLQHCLRKEDTIVRWAGDEFAIILELVTVQQVEQVAEKVAEAVRTRPLALGDRTAQIVTVSVGWSFLTDELRALGQQGWDEAFAAADGALYSAKQDGRNCARGGECPTSETRLVG